MIHYCDDCANHICTVLGRCERMQAAIAEYERAMREDVIPQIERDMKAQQRAAHFLRLGIPDPIAPVGTRRGGAA